MGPRIRVLHGDSRRLLRTFAADLADSVVCDPPYELGFMGKAWDRRGIAYNVGLWRQALRVVKPGGYLLAFGATRTYHRMACAVEDAGWEIRDSIHWLYGSGFPKSHNVGNDIDKLQGCGDRGRAIPVASTHLPSGHYRSERLRANPVERYEGRTPEGKKWQGFGTALKPAHEPILVARKPFTESTCARNVLQHGTGALNIEACRVGDDAVRIHGKGNENFFQGGFDPNGEWEGADREGRYPANLILSHSADCAPANCVPWCPLNQLGPSVSYFYCPKATKREKSAGLWGLDRQRVSAGRRDDADAERLNTHPTIKPVELMRYLCRLVTPPGGRIIDPFCGSGSTGIAAALEGFSFVGIEREAEYVQIARKRIEYWEKREAGKHRERGRRGGRRRRGSNGSRSRGCRGGQRQRARAARPDDAVEGNPPS